MAKIVIFMCKFEVNFYGDFLCKISSINVSFNKNLFQISSSTCLVHLLSALTVWSSSSRATCAWPTSWQSLTHSVKKGGHHRRRGGVAVVLCLLWPARFRQGSRSSIGCRHFSPRPILKFLSLVKGALLALKALAQVFGRGMSQGA